MGYDMTWEHEPEVVAAAYKEAFGDKVIPEKVREWGALQQEAGSYYRLNIWGMGSMRQILHAGGCLNVDADVEALDTETGGVLPAIKVSDNSGWLVTPSECIATAMTWFEGAGRERAREGVEEVLESFEEGATVEQVLEWADEFVQWMSLAASHGGFRVY